MLRVGGDPASGWGVVGTDRMSPAPAVPFCCDGFAENTVVPPSPWPDIAAAKGNC